MWEPDTLRAGPAGPGRSEDAMSGKKKRGSARAVPRAYGRLTRHERDTVQRMLERGASCREIARELGRWIGNTYLDDSGRDSPASLNSTGDM